MGDSPIPSAFRSAPMAICTSAVMIIARYCVTTANPGHSWMFSSKREAADYSTLVRYDARNGKYLDEFIPAKTNGLLQGEYMSSRLIATGGWKFAVPAKHAGSSR